MVWRRQTDVTGFDGRRDRRGRGRTYLERGGVTGVGLITLVTVEEDGDGEQEDGEDTILPLYTVLILKDFSGHSKT